MNNIPSSTHPRIEIHADQDSENHTTTHQTNTNNSPNNTSNTNTNSQSESDLDYANKPPPIPLPSSPSYSYYLEAVEISDLDAVNINDMEMVDINEMLRRPSPPRRTVDNPRVEGLVPRIETLEPRITRRRPSATSVEEEHANTSEQDSSENYNSTKALKSMVFTLVNPRQHLALSLCRDMPIWYCLYYSASYCAAAYNLQYNRQQSVIVQAHETRKQYNEIVLANMLTTRSSEYVITAMWCVVTAFLGYCILDGLIVRWVVVYTIPAAMLRMVSMSVMVMSIIRLILMICNPNDSYLLHSWIFISCIFTVTYIVQNFFVHNLDEKIRGADEEEEETDAAGGRGALSNILNGSVRQKPSRYFDYYNIVIYAVMPLGVASFITMTVLLRNILILKLDIETLYRADF